MTYKDYIVDYIVLAFFGLVITLFLINISLWAEKHCIQGVMKVPYNNSLPNQIDIDVINFCWDTF